MSYFNMLLKYPRYSAQKANTGNSTSVADPPTQEFQQNIIPDRTYQKRTRSDRPVEGASKQIGTGTGGMESNRAKGHGDYNHDYLEVSTGSLLSNYLSLL